MTPLALLAPYHHLSLSAWDRLRLGVSLCVNAGLTVQAFRGGETEEGYWFSCEGRLIYCGRCNSYSANWQEMPLDLLQSLSPMEVHALPPAQLGFLMVESPHFDHC